jgi:predicted MPP superfamily phosphohydrolase
MLLLLFLSSNIYGLTIYDLQYTSNPGSDNTYPSPYDNDDVTVTGIVTADNYSGNRFFISMPEGGAWKGIYVYHNYSLNIGDEVSVSGEVSEYWGLTEISSVSNVSVLSSGNDVNPTIITSGQLNSLEAYEGVYVTIMNAAISESYDEYGNFKINDGSGAAYVGTGCVSLMNDNFDAIEGAMLSSISGVVSYSYGNYYLNPRSMNDVVVGDMPITIATEDIFINQSTEFQIPLKIFNQDDLEINSFHIELSYNNNMVEFNGLDFSSAILSGATFSSSSNTITVDYTGSAISSTSSTLFNLLFSPIRMGNTTFFAYECSVNGEAVESFNFGDLNISVVSTEQGDILTTVQRPIMSIPTITHPNETFEIWASAPQSTSGWEVSLQYEDYILALDIVSTQYDSTRNWHIITVQTPQPAFYELFDLVVDAPSLEVDEVQNAVKIEAEPEDDWYFIQVTDTHLPTHLFSHDSNYYNDMTEIEDFLTVIEDINIINPKFVLFTGDVVNEGELEEYLDARYYSIAKNTIGLLEAPVYIVTGNHDIGGWNDTPMPDGSSRSNWHNFFGWDILENPNGIYPYRTQNYTFNYNGVKFIGMESYVNYDNYLPNIFGDESFTNNQMSWLNSEVATPEDTKVMFYHYDFSDQLNLNSLGVDMSLAGHIHYDEGSISQQPYELHTGSTCDGNRKYRVIKVHNGVLQPFESVTAGGSGQNFQINFEFPNNGTTNHNIAEIVNMHNIDFDDLVIKFELPATAWGIEVNNGTIMQVAEVDDKKVVYVKAAIEANSVLQVEVVSGTPNSDNEVTPHKVMNNVTIYPNPHKTSVNRAAAKISFDLTKKAQVSASVYNLKGQKVAQVAKNQAMEAGNHLLSWDGIADLASGLYLIKVEANQDSKIMKFIHVK